MNKLLAAIGLSALVNINACGSTSPFNEDAKRPLDRLNAYQYQGNCDPLTQLPNVVDSTYQESNASLHSAWKELDIDSGDTLTLQQDSYYVIEWNGIKDYRGTTLNFYPKSLFGDSLNELELGRYYEGDCRGIMIGPIKSIGETHKGHRKIELNDKDTQQSLGFIVIALANI